MTDIQIANKIKRIPAHSIHKLNSFELLYAAAEYEKYEISDLEIQAGKLQLSVQEKEELAKRFTSFETELNAGSWSIARPTIR